MATTWKNEDLTCAAFDIPRWGDGTQISCRLLPTRGHACETCWLLRWLEQERRRARLGKMFSDDGPTLL